MKGRAKRLRDYEEVIKAAVAHLILNSNNPHCQNIVIWSVGGEADENGCEQSQRKRTYAKVTKKSLVSKSHWKTRGFSRLYILGGRSLL